MTAEENTNTSAEAGTGQACEYHVVWDRKRSRYHVVRNDRLSFGFSGHRGGAIGIAMRAAIKDAENGVRTSVLVQQKGRSSKVMWTS